METINNIIKTIEELSGTNAVYIIGLAILAGYVIDGWKKGFLKQLLQTLATIIAAVVTKLTYAGIVAYVIDRWNPAAPEKTITVIVIVVVFIIALVLVSVIADATKLFNKVPGLGLINRILGIIFAIIRFAVLAAFAYLILLTIGNMR